MTLSSLRLSHRRRFYKVLREPLLVDFFSSSSGNPVIDPHLVGDLLVCVGTHANSNAEITTPTGWTQWLTASGNLASMKVVYKIATTTSETIDWASLATGTRAGWVFRDAKIGSIAITNGAALTAMSYPSLSIATPSVLCSFVHTRNNQTSLEAAVGQVGWNTRIHNNTVGTPGRLIQDTGATTLPNTDLSLQTLLSSYAGGADTYDTAPNGNNVCVFSIQGK
jgi:hypothetical protein